MAVADRLPQHAAGDDPRITGTRGDVRQRRTLRADGSYTGDSCRAGGLDSDNYGT